MPADQDELELQKSGMLAWAIDVNEAIQYWIKLPATPPLPILQPGQRKSKKYYEATTLYQERHLLNQYKESRINFFKEALVKAGFSLPEGV